MDSIQFKKLEISDIPAFVELRINQLKEEGNQQDFDLSPSLYSFYEKHVNDGTFVAWLAFEGTQIVGTSGMSFVEKSPYYSNPSGKIGLLSNMYTLKSHRRRGIAKQLLNKVVEEARQYGCGAVHITASEQGVLLYTEYGFKKNNNFMQYLL